MVDAIKVARIRVQAFNGNFGGLAAGRRNDGCDFGISPRLSLLLPILDKNLRTRNSKNTDGNLASCRASQNNIVYVRATATGGSCRGAEGIAYAADGDDRGDGCRRVGGTGVTDTYGLTAADGARATGIGTALNTVFTAGYTDGSGRINSRYGKRG